jgi:hypothetical protein
MANIVADVAPPGCRDYRRGRGLAGVQREPVSARATDAGNRRNGDRKNARQGGHGVIG